MKRYATTKTLNINYANLNYFNNMRKCLRNKHGDNYISIFQQYKNYNTRKKKKIKKKKEQ